ncbi:hypothetical protein PV08_11199 [Exophiala spinifera]|uniref:5'-3' DNA helicase ZGRF1-like N-terminal domain-containing protein n=1 Tax=Exophiala spinifera TaxID=91928 RepID=A0A0D1ZB38_9EURO|nr:uncharacterized protein PV08_11199 [Exophiala spinifera]KIW10237.1 hypothetical protein PV08_11199 [Exophiala spinifera]
MVAGASVHRGTPTSSVAPTQNTAPVHEFRCLYTRDLLKKAKKWHDGSLRFHTFNRRVMVYDDAKNYIGDLHYRQEEEFDEGVEIELDRGVKVEVGERMGETETDLAPILERQRPEKATPRKGPAGGSGGFLASTIHSQRPKSLLEVLGPSQGRLRHSRLPLQSPYEQRQAASRPERNEPHLKKRRLSNDKENLLDETVRLVRPSRPCLPQPICHSKPDTSPLVRKPPTKSRPVVEISSDEDSNHDRRTQPRTSIVSSYEPSRAVGRSQGVSKSVSALRETEIRETNVVKTQAMGQIRRDIRRPQIPKSTSSRPRFSIQRKARLLLGRPRPKSTLTVLQPFEKAASRLGVGTPVVTVSPREEACSPIPPAPSPDAQRNTVSPRVDAGSCGRLNNISGVRQFTGNVTGPETIDSSPLFLPEDENRAPRSPTPPPLPTQEEFPFLTMSISELAPHEPLEHNNPSFVRQSAYAEEEFQNAPELDTVDLSSPDSPIAQEFEEPLVPFVITTGPTLQPSARQFRRVFSENDAVTEDDDAQTHAGQGNLELRSPLKILNAWSTRQSPVKSKSPPKFQRCVSDTPALKDPIEDFSGEGHGQDQEGQTGPWTSDEAFLLFDWWPPGIEKPEYWAATVEKPCAPSAVVAGDVMSGYPTIITTARQFLRDDVNAL